MARYAGLLLAPAEGFGLRPRIFVKTKIIQKTNHEKKIHIKTPKIQKLLKMVKKSKNIKNL